MTRRLGGEAPPTLECRICLEPDVRANLISACDCDGSVRWTHKACLGQWLAESGRTTCEICHARYKGVDDLVYPLPDLELADIHRHERFVEGFDLEEGAWQEHHQREIEAMWSRLRSALMMMLAITVLFVLLGAKQPVYRPSDSHVRARGGLRDVLRAGANETRGGWLRRGEPLAADSLFDRHSTYGPDFVDSPQHRLGPDDALFEAHDGANATAQLPGGSAEGSPDHQREREYYDRRDRWLHEQRRAAASRHRVGGGAWERMIHACFMLFMLRLVILRQRQLRLQDRGYDGDPFGLFHDQHPFGAPFDADRRAMYVRYGVAGDRLGRPRFIRV